MDLYSHINKYIVKPLWIKTRGNNYFPIIPAIKKLYSRQLEEIREYQFNMLRKLFEHAYNSVPLYRREWDDCGFSPQEFKSLDDIGKIPLLTKEKIRNNYDLLLAEGSKTKNLTISGTGGTTDSPIIIKYDKDRARIKDAEMHFFRGWWGWNLGSKVLGLWGAPQDIPNVKSLKYRTRNLFIDRFLIMFSSYMDTQTMNSFVARINKFRPEIIQGYSNALFILSLHIINNNIKAHSPKSVIVTAEPCSDYQRKIIKTAFKADIFSFYGSREGGYMGVECKAHNGYHINCYSLYLEFLNPENNLCAGNEMGKIVFTDLFNYDMPFIRYEIGDMGSPADKQCSCGSPLPLMNFLAGREADVFKMPNGSFVPGVALCDRITTDCKGIEQLQFIQEKIDHLHVKIVKGSDYTINDMMLLDQGLDNYFKGMLKITKEFVGSIPKAKSGKTRFCISKVTTNDLRNMTV